MSENNVNLAVAYYHAVNDNNIAFIEKCLHPDVKIISPLAQLTGKTAYLESVKKFCSLFNKLTIRAQFGSVNQAMLALDLDCPTPIGIFRAAALITFKDDFIICNELFYDARLIEKKGNEIFSKS